MAHYTYEGPYVIFEERVQIISRYTADHGVAFPDLLNTEADELGPATTHEIVPPFFKIKSHSTEMVRGTCTQCNEKISPPPKMVPRTNFGSQNWPPLANFGPHENVILQPSKVASYS